ncbi:unnamed protein product [Hyaloperonospora brassicae]|uniref:RxLR effector candidate protein n=1 Tax=Hyaloperonospora brassicae TaxID=162125 RepID=A0AAV0T188_HYABA|nr:unnamed protein product [Hyaloperonospora brassicae]
MPPSPRSVERPEGEQQRGGEHMATRTITHPRGPEDETLWDEGRHLLRMDPCLMMESQDVAVASLRSSQKHRRHQQRTASGRLCPRTKSTGYKKGPRAVDWKRQGTARQDASRYDEKVEVSGPEDDVSGPEDDVSRL